LYSGFGRRFLAGLVDGLLMFILGFVVQSSLGLDPFQVFRAESLEQLNKINQSSNNLLLTLIGFVLTVVYYLIFWVHYEGATPGKKLLAIKIVRDNGEKINYPHAFIRYLASFISALSIFIFGLGYLWMIWDKRKQTWHDKIAGTIVVKTDKKPKILLAVFISLLTIFVFFGYMSALVVKSFMLGYQDSKKNTGNYERQSFKNSLKTMSPQAKVYYDRSQELFKEIKIEQNNPEKVKKINDENIEQLNKALEIDPNNAVIWRELGSAYTWISSNGTLEDGLNAYKKAEDLDPENVVYINKVGDMLIRLGKNEEAILQFQKTFRLTDKSGYAYLSIGIAYKNLKIYDEARKNLTKAIEVFRGENQDGSYDDQILMAQKELANLPK